MECLYTPDLTLTTKTINLSQDEIRHAKALRVEIGQRILLTSGKGLMAKAELIDNEKYALKVLEIRENIHELPIRFGIAFSVLSSKERMEFAIEKLTELGITDFHFVDAAHSQIHTIDEERLLNKAIAAIKQSKRSILPIIHSISSTNGIQNFVKDYSAIVLADVHGNTSFPKQLLLENIPNGVLICIGPEGGYSDHEVSMIKSFPHCISISLANRRLRAETAAMALASICQFHWLE